jgi:hypothetical protein
MSVRKVSVFNRAHALAAAFIAVLLSFLAPSFSAAESISRYPRFCAACGFHGVESFSGQSGQFVVHSSPVPARQLPRLGNSALIQLEPEFVLVAAERTKRALCQELRIQDNFKDKIHISVLDRAPAGQRVAVVSQIHSDGFFYKVGFPAQIELIQMAKGLVQTVLLELANRGSQRAAELPTWLVEGMTRQAFTAIQPAYVINSRPITFETAGYDRLGTTRGYFQTNAPLTIQELSFPNFSKFTPEERERFEGSSHLLVHRLLLVSGGPARMANFIQLLPRTLNWQTALFTAYKGHFDGPLQFEKWWMLNWLEFSMRRDHEYWPLERTLARLDSLLSTAMEVRTTTNNIPAFRDTPIQELLQSTDFNVQKELLGQKVQHLFFLSMNVPTEALPLWSAYQRAIDSYLQKRGLHDYQPALKSDPEQRLQALIKSTVKTLDELDFARNELKEGRAPILPKDLSRQASASTPTLNPNP